LKIKIKSAKTDDHAYLCLDVIANFKSAGYLVVCFDVHGPDRF